MFEMIAKWRNQHKIYLFGLMHFISSNPWPIASLWNRTWYISHHWHWDTWPLFFVVSSCNMTWGL